jgi:hypothetical protein
MNHPQRFAIALIIGLGVLHATPGQAHVPYFEHRDWTERRPFLVQGAVEQSIAVYSWLSWDETGQSLDVDYYELDIDEVADVYIEAIVPACAGYEDFMPWFALIGPELPPPVFDLPDEVQLPPGHGAIVVPGPWPGEPREIFYEPFGGKSYFQGQTATVTLDTPGTYRVIYWDPYEAGGDYVAVLGDQEIWRREDMMRALVYTPLIRKDRELHTDCVDVGGEISVY